jgi:hypothetical protein
VNSPATPRRRTKFAKSSPSVFPVLSPWSPCPPWFRTVFCHQEQGEASRRDQNLRWRTRFGQVVVRRAKEAKRCSTAALGGGIAGIPCSEYRLPADLKVLRPSRVQSDVAEKNAKRRKKGGPRRPLLLGPITCHLSGGRIANRWPVASAGQPAKQIRLCFMPLRLQTRKNRPR